MKHRSLRIALLAVYAFAAASGSSAWAQQTMDHSSMPGMSMPGQNQNAAGAGSSSGNGAMRSGTATPGGRSASGASSPAPTAGSNDRTVAANSSASRTRPTRADRN